MQYFHGEAGLPVSKTFQDTISTVNGLKRQDFREWLFLPGMLFGAGEKWWGKGGKRETLHEGLDICYYRTTEPDIRQITPGTKIPVIYPGTVTTVIDDFLGKSIFIKHEQYRVKRATLYTAYGHTQPVSSLQPGVKVSESEIIGAAAETNRKRQGVPCHIHISAAWVPDELPGQGLNWEIMKNMILLDPLSLLELPYSGVSSLED